MQLAEVPPPASTQAPPWPKPPRPSLANRIVPVGVDGPLPKSVIVAVHVVDRPASTELGEHRTAAAVGRPVTATEVDAVSTACVESPLYAPLIRCVPEPTAVGVYETAQVPVDPVAVRLH